MRSLLVGLLGVRGGRMLLRRRCGRRLGRDRRCGGLRLLFVWGRRCAEGRWVVGLRSLSFRFRCSRGLRGGGARNCLLMCTRQEILRRVVASLGR